MPLRGNGDVRYQLRICPKGLPTCDFYVSAPVLPRVGESIVTGGDRYWVKYVDHEFDESLSEPPKIIVVARWSDE